VTRVRRTCVHKNFLLQGVDILIDITSGGLGGSLGDEIFSEYLRTISFAADYFMGLCDEFPFGWEEGGENNKIFGNQDLSARSRMFLAYQAVLYVMDPPLTASSEEAVSGQPLLHALSIAAAEFLCRAVLGNRDFLAKAREPPLEMDSQILGEEMTQLSELVSRFLEEQVNDEMIQALAKTTNPAKFRFLDRDGLQILVERLTETKQTAVNACKISSGKAESFLDINEDGEKDGSHDGL
jgi:hypothetical protein